MSTAILSSRAIQRKTSLAERVKIPWKTFYSLVAAVALALLTLYIFRINELTRGAFLIKDYRREITSLSEESNLLQAQFADNDFLASVAEKAEALSFEKSVDVKYIQVLQSSLAEIR